MKGFSKGDGYGWVKRLSSISHHPHTSSVKSTESTEKSRDLEEMTTIGRTWTQLDSTGEAEETSDWWPTLQDEHWKLRRALLSTGRTSLDRM